MNIAFSSSPRIVIIGGGFAGVNFAKMMRNKGFQIVLLDKHNYHNFQPLLYQVATGGLEAGSIAYPIRKVIQEHENFYFRLAKVNEIDAKNNKIIADIGELTYDYLIIATGSKTNYFGNKEIKKHSMAMKTIPQSLNIRSLVLENFEQALLTTDLKERQSLMNFVIVGGGATGVELSGALAEMKKGILPKDYPDLDLRMMQINLIQSGDRILNTMSEKASRKAEDFLHSLGVSVWKNIRVENYDGRWVTTNTDLVFDCATFIWTAGVQGALLKGLKADAMEKKAGRIKVNHFNQVVGYDTIFAIGDIALMEDKEYPFGHPMMAQPAIQQGKWLAGNLVRHSKKQDMKPFVYKDKGAMATIGRNKAVVDLPKWHFNGVFAWFVWMFVHLFSLIGFKNKMVVLFSWIYNYIRFDKESRLIIRPFKRKDITSFISNSDD